MFRRVSWAALPSVLVLLVACGESGGNGSAAGLVRMEEEPSGTNCPNGGVALMTGLDDNANGVLDDSEVDATEYVCNGSGSHAMLMNVAEEPEGEFCPTGGLIITSGLDLNDDGVLGADEVTSTDYLCNGRPGSGLNSIVSVEEEPPGENCEGGGQAIQSGLDDNGDGVLQPDEVDSTVFVCHGAGRSSLVRQADEPPGENCEHGGQALMSGLDLDDDGYLDDEEVTTTSYLCNGDQGEPGAPGVFDVTEVPPGGECASGGMEISTGTDLNGNGTLDPDEVTATQTICYGEGGGVAAPILIDVSDEPAGDHCAAGGQRIDVGPDENGNGELDAAEIDSTDYVCDAEGMSSLVDVTDVPPGDECSAGGVRLDTGLDANGNGTLDAGEIATTDYICSGGEGTATAVRVSRAAWGGVCPRGGVRVETGVDDDGDGELDDDEVDEESYLCNVAYVQVTGGYQHTCGLTSDGRVRCWGLNNRGQLGNGNTTQHLLPVLVEGLTGVASIDAGGYHTCAVRTDGNVYCWGWNNFGQLGDGTTTDRHLPVHVSTLSDVVQVSANEYHTCARIEDGSVECWGRNNQGQIGDGSTSNRYFPTEVAGLDDVVSVATGGQHSCAVQESGRVRCWGYNGHGELGDATTTRRTTPVMVGVIDDAEAVVAGYYHTCARLSDGRGRCWGYNGHGELGDATTRSSTSPVLINGLSTIETIAAGYYHTCAILDDETVRCWGYNGHGELGDGTTSHRNVPVEVVGEDDGLQIDAGQYQTCMVRNEGRAFCWGYNGHGELGDGTTTNSYFPTAVFLDHSL